MYDRYFLVIKAIMWNSSTSLLTLTNKKEKLNNHHDHESSLQIKV